MARSLISKLLSGTALTQESVSDGQSFIQSPFQNLQVLGAPAFSFSNDFVRLFNFGKIQTEGAEAAVLVTGENADIVNFRSGVIDADNGEDASATGVEVLGSARVRNFGEISGETNGVSFGEDASGQLDNFRGATISSDSRAVDILGDDVSVRNLGDIVGTDNQRNGTVYTNNTADDFSIRNFTNATIDAGEGNLGSGISVEVDDSNDGSITNGRGAVIQGRGQAASNTTLAGDGIVVRGISDDSSFEGLIRNSGLISSESTQGTTAGIRITDGVGFDGNIINGRSGTIEGAQNGLYFGNAEHDANVLNAGTIASGSRALNIDGSGVDVFNSGQIIGTGDQRNGTIYSDDTASDFSINNGSRGVVDAGEGNNGSGITLSLDLDGPGAETSITNAGTIAGRGQAAANLATAGDGIRLEGVRGKNGIEEALFEGTITNSGTVSSESDQGTTGAFRTTDNVNFQGTLINEEGGLFEGGQNGVYFGNGDHTGGEFRNEGTVTSDSRAVNIDGVGLTVNNSGDILGTDNQRNGTVYADGTAQEFTVNNLEGGLIDAGEGNTGSGFGAEISGENTFTLNNEGTIAGRGNADAGTNAAGDGVRIGNPGNSGIADADITNSGTITSEGANGTVAGVRFVDNVGFKGTLDNSGTIAGVQNGLYFGNADHSDGIVNNSGTISSDSRAFNVDGIGLTVNNSGEIVGTGDQRNGTFYADATADQYTLNNLEDGIIDAGLGNNGSGVALQTGDVDGDTVTASINNDGLIQGRGDAVEGNLVGDGVRLFSGQEDVTFQGNIVNGEGGVISGSAESAEAAGISIEDGITLAGVIINDGEINGSVNAIDAREAGDVNIFNAGEINGNVLLGDGDDILIGDTGTINGIVDGGAGDDTIITGAEDNILVGGAGSDTLFGGKGVDTADFSDLQGPLVVDLKEGTVTDNLGFAADVAKQPLINPNLGVTNELAPADIVSEAIAGNIYFNVHSTFAPSGEVRGQLSLVSDVIDGHRGRIVTLEAQLDGAQEVPTPIDTPATGTATVTFILNERGDVVSYETDLDVTGLIGDLLPVNIGNGTLSPIHLHNAPAGVNGPVVVDVASDAGEGLVIVADVDQLDEIENIILSDGNDVVLAAELPSIDGVVDAGEGIDTIDFSNFNEGISVDLDLNTPQPGPASQDGALVTQVGPNGEVIQEFDNFENVVGSDFDDVIFGNNEINVLEGGEGNDTIHSFGGADTLDGGEGIDTALFTAGGAVTVDLDDLGNATSSLGDTLISFENVNGSNTGNDDISGNAGENTLRGQGGDDLLTGELGNDILDGGLGNDTASFDDLNVGIVADLQNGVVTRQGFTANVAPQAAINPNLALNNVAPAQILSEAVAGNIYFNVHTTFAPSGEVRGQLELASDVLVGGVRTVTLTAALDGAQEIPAPIDTPATGTATVVFTVENGIVSYETDLDVSNLVGDLLPVNIGNGTLSPIHLHNAPFGVNGPVVLDVATDAGPENLVIVDETDTLISIENIIGSGGDDVIISSDGDNVLTGGEGKDFFVFNSDSANDTVTDFEDGSDLLDVSGLGAEFNLADAIDGARQVEGDTLITLSEDDSVLLQDFLVDDLDETDFVIEAGVAPVAAPAVIEEVIIEEVEAVEVIEEVVAEEVIEEEVLEEEFVEAQEPLIVDDLADDFEVEEDALEDDFADDFDLAEIEALLADFEGLLNEEFTL